MDNWKNRKGVVTIENYLLCLCLFLVACTWTKDKLSWFLSSGSASSWRCCRLLTCPFVWVWRCRTCRCSSWRAFRYLFWALTIQPLSGTSKWFEFWFIFNISVLIWRLPKQKVGFRRASQLSSVVHRQVAQDVQQYFEADNNKHKIQQTSRGWLMPL